jgi:hypothetical protein
MTRILLRTLVPFLLPIAVYAAWVWYRTRYVAEHHGEPPRFERGPWPQLLFLGALLALASFAATALLKGGDAGSEYTPSYLDHGQVVPGRIAPRAP